MRLDLRHTLVVTLAAFGSGLLAVAAIDWFAYVFAGVDIVGYEQRLHPRGGWLSMFSDPFNSVAGRAVPVCAALGLVVAIGAAALARILRPARVLLVLAAIFTALVVALTASTTRELHTTFAGQTASVDPDTGLRSLVRDTAHRYDLDRRLGVQRLGTIALTLLLPTLAVAAVRVATRRGAPRARTARTAAALALPLTVAAAALSLLWRTYGDFAPTDHEGWADLVRAARPAPLVAALLVALAALAPRDEPRPPVRHLVLAALLLALGVAAVCATTPHRRTIDSLYPLRDPGGKPFYWQPRLAPWRFDAPPATACVEPDIPRYWLTFYRDAAGAVGVSIGDVGADLRDEAEMTGLLAALSADLTLPFAPPSPLVLLIDRRIALAELVPALARFPSLTISPLLIAGTVTQPLPTAEGPAVAVILCVTGQLRFTDLVDPTLPADATWGTITDDPARVRPVTWRPLR